MENTVDFDSTHIPIEVVLECLPFVLIVDGRECLILHEYAKVLVNQIPHVPVDGAQSQLILKLKEFADVAESVEVSEGCLRFLH